MNKRTYTHRLICSVILALAVLVPAIVMAADLTVFRAAPANGLDPADPAWATVAAAPLVLDNRWDWPDRHVFPAGTGTRTYNIKAIHDGANIFFRFQWSDSTQNTTTTDVPTYPDGAAIMFPMWDWTNVCTPAQADNMFMGVFQWDPAAFGITDPACAGLLVDLVTNIHLWKGNYTKPMNIMAVGELGTVHKTGNPPENGPAPARMDGSHPVAPPPVPDPGQNLVQSVQYAAGVWTVIIARPLAAYDANTQFDFASRLGVTGIPFSLANWDGQLQERANRKFAPPDWYRMDIQP